MAKTAHYHPPQANIGEITPSTEGVERQREQKGKK